MAQLIKQAIASESMLGNACKPYVQKKLPSKLIWSIYCLKLNKN